jgi:hypothetical protein
MLDRDLYFRVKMPVSIRMWDLVPAPKTGGRLSLCLVRARPELSTGARAMIRRIWPDKGRL